MTVFLLERLDLGDVFLEAFPRKYFVAGRLLGEISCLMFVVASSSSNT